MTNNPLKSVAVIWGVFAGLGGLRHGIGEILQGNVATGGIYINSWITGPLFTEMGGEPGITLIPNMLVTGIVTLIVSLAIIVWAAAFMHKKRSGLVLILLNILLLLTGGGVGPPVTGLLAGWAGTKIHSPLRWWESHVPDGVHQFFSRIHSWLLTLCLIASVVLFILSIPIVYLLDMNNDALFVNIFFLVVFSLVLTIVTGFSYSIQKTGQPATV